MDRDVLRQLAEELIPFNKFLGVRLGAMDRGRVELEIPWRDELVGDPFRPAMHGGVISALADAAGGAALWSTFDHPGQRVSTIDLRIDYLRPGRLEAIVAEAVVVRAGRTIGVVDVRVFHPSSRDEVMATGKGVYSIKSPRAAPVRE